MHIHEGQLFQGIRSKQYTQFLGIHNSTHIKATHTYKNVTYDALTPNFVQVLVMLMEQLGFIRRAR